MGWGEIIYFVHNSIKSRSYAMWSSRRKNLPRRLTDLPIYTSTLHLRKTFLLHLPSLIQTGNDKVYLVRLVFFIFVYFFIDIFRRRVYYHHQPTFLFKTKDRRIALVIPVNRFFYFSFSGLSLAISLFLYNIAC